MNCSLGLGTAQFNGTYGLNGGNNQLHSFKDVAQILSHANRHEVFQVLDLSNGYENSIDLVGKYIKEQGTRLRLILKYYEPNKQEKKSILESINVLLDRLHVDKVDTIMLHNFQQYYENQHRWEDLQHCKKTGMTNKIGFSLYHPSEIRHLNRLHVDFDILQIPVSVFDRRFAHWKQYLKTNNVEIHARSLFLQGLLLMETKQIPDIFYEQHEKDFYQKHKRFHRLCKTYGVSPRDVCLNSVRSLDWVDVCVVGVDGLDQLQTNTESWGEKIPEELMHELYQMYVSENILDPTRWKPNGGMV